MSDRGKRRRLIQAWHVRKRERVRPRPNGERVYEPADEIVISVPDPNRPGHPLRYKARIIERLGDRSPGEQEEER